MEISFPGAESLKVHRKQTINPLLWGGFGFQHKDVMDRGTQHTTTRGFTQSRTQVR